MLPFDDARRTLDLGVHDLPVAGRPCYRVPMSDDFSFSNLFAGLLFGSVGVVAWRYGRKQERARAMVLGLLLIAFPWVTPTAFWTWLVGAVLVGLLFWP